MSYIQNLPTVCMNVPALIDRNTGKHSYTLTALVAGFFIINIKLLLSGVQLTEYIKFSEFSGVDYGAALAGLGTIYNWGKAKKESSEEQK